MLSISDIITYFLLFQLGNWSSYFILRTSLDTSIASLFFTGIFTAMLCLLAITKGA